MDTHRRTGAGASDRFGGTTDDNLETACLRSDIGITTATSVVQSDVAGAEGLDERSCIAGLV